MLNKKILTENNILNINNSGGVFMPRKIAVQNGLYEIKSNLINSGFEIYNIEDGENVEAIVYISDGDNIPYNNHFTNMSDADNLRDTHSAILINANGKSFEEIKHIINSRIYSPLFDR